MTSDLMRKLEQVAHDRGAWFEAEDDDQIAYVGFNGGEVEYYSRFEDGRYVVFRSSRGNESVQGRFADVGHAVLLISLLVDDGLHSEPDELLGIDHVIEGDPSISDERLSVIIDRYIDPSFYGLDGARNSNCVWVRVGVRSHDVVYRDPVGSDGVISSSAVTDSYDMRAHDVGVMCNYAWTLQYAWRRILDWGFPPDDLELVPILRRVLDVEGPLEP